MRLSGSPRPAPGAPATGGPPDTRARFSPRYGSPSGLTYAR